MPNKDVIDEIRVFDANESKIAHSKTEEKSDIQILRLQESLEHEKDIRKHERFFWGCLVGFLLDGYVLKEINWFSQVLLVVTQIALLICFARACGIQEFEHLLYRVLGKARIMRAKNFSKEKSTD